jgi:hypothetical protein
VRKKAFRNEPQRNAFIPEWGWGDYVQVPELRKERRGKPEDGEESDMPALRVPYSREGKAQDSEKGEGGVIMEKEPRLKLISEDSEWRIIQDRGEAGIYNIGLRKSDNRIFEIGYNDVQKFISENRM